MRRGNDRARGPDTLVLTHGIEEPAAPVRWQVDAGLVGIQLDEQRNAVHADPISSPLSPGVVYVISTNGNFMITRHTCALLLYCSSTPVSGGKA